MAEVTGAERVYLLSLGSMQGNAHVHWHVAPLPPGVPYEQQQYHALMTENGVLPYTRQEFAEFGARIRAALGGGPAGSRTAPAETGGQASA